jgi:rare lipoprotein A
MLSSCGHKITETGKASYYADKFDGRTTSNGETFRQSKRTAAHRTIPFGTKVLVKNLKNGKTVKVRINDRGPFVKGRMIDLSKKAAKRLDMVNAGVAEVEIKYKEKSK